MNALLIIFFPWTAGVLLAYHMMRIEHEAEKKVFTVGDRLLMSFLSVFSIAMVLFILINCWISHIGKTGYWNKPVKPKSE